MPNEPEKLLPIYVASRASLPERGAMWRKFRDSGVPVTSSWIDEDGEGQSVSMADLWERIGNEIAQANVLVLYAETDDFPLKGALIEAGIALGMGKRVVVCLPDVDVAARSCRPIGSWINHPLVSRVDDIDGAVKIASSFTFNTRVPFYPEAEGRIAEIRRWRANFTSYRKTPEWIIAQAMEYVDELLAMLDSRPISPQVTLSELVQRISDPDAFLPRGDSYHEPITSWSARAVLQLLNEHCKSRPISQDGARSTVGYVRRLCGGCGEGLAYQEDDPCDKCADITADSRHEEDEQQ